jgi:xanthine dehydrogenase accessory factor
MMLESDRVLERAASLHSQGRPFALATVVRCESPTSAKPGAKALVEPDGTIHGWIGGGCAQPAVIKTAKRALAEGRPYLIRISPEKDGAIEEGVLDFGMTCHSGGTLDIFIDPLVPRPRLLIIGASPAGQCLSALAARVGFAVTAAFPGVTPEMFPDAERLVGGLEVAAEDHPSAHLVVVSTQGKRDEEGLEAALSTGASYIAFIASERKAAKVRDYLRERGHDRARVDAILAPAGIEIGAVTPEEIALSVLADVVRYRRAVSSVEAPNREGPPKAAAPGAQAVDPVCGMTVETRGAEHTTLYRGETYYFCCAGCQHAFEKAPEDYLPAAGARA